MQIPTFTKDEFISSTTPYEYLHGLRKDPIRHEQAFAAIKDNAHAVGIRNFEKMYECYEKSLGVRLVSHQG